MSQIGQVEADIKPCPFCEAPAVLENFVIEAAVRCTASYCGAKIVRKHSPREDTGIELARKAWNRRAGSW